MPQEHIARVFERLGGSASISRRSNAAAMAPSSNFWFRLTRGGCRHRSPEKFESIKLKSLRSKTATSEFHRIMKRLLIVQARLSPRVASGSAIPGGPTLREFMSTWSERMRLILFIGLAAMLAWHAEHSAHEIGRCHRKHRTTRIKAAWHSTAMAGSFFSAAATPRHRVCALPRFVPRR